LVNVAGPADAELATVRVQSNVPFPKTIEPVVVFPVMLLTFVIVRSGASGTVLLASGEFTPLAEP